MNTSTMIALPRVIAGTSLLGNLYEELSFDQKKEIVNAYITAMGYLPCLILRVNMVLG